MESYTTVAEYTTARHTAGDSRFIGHIAPAFSIEAAEAIIEDVRSEYDDATHNVPAYRIYEGEFLREYASDDGEPRGSAGDPVATVLDGADLVNVVAVVTRYYGGTNLGIGGLVTAYATTTQSVVDAAALVTQRPHRQCRITAAYDESGTVRSVLERADCAFEAAYEETVTFEARLPVATHEQIIDRLRSATGDRVDIEWPDGSRETYTDGPA